MPVTLNRYNLKGVKIKNIGNKSYQLSKHYDYYVLVLRIDNGIVYITNPYNNIHSCFQELRSYMGYQ